jgi:hypothetical protein
MEEIGLGHVAKAMAKKEEKPKVCYIAFYLFFFSYNSIPP